MTDTKSPHLGIHRIPVLCHIETDFPFSKAFRQHFQTVCRCNVYVGNTTGVHNYYFCILPDTVFNIFLEHLDICKEQAFAELIDYYMFNLIGIPVLAHIIESIPPRNHPQKGSGRVGSFQDHGHKGEQDSDNDAIDGSKHQHA